MRKVIWLMAMGWLLLALAGCAAPVAVEQAAPLPGMGMGNGMMQRHHAPVPAEYAGLQNPLSAGEESWARGAELYAVQCASCHGDGGMGDGPAGAALDPAPAPLAHTSQMMADDYLFWRISEGGAVFSSAMPAWKAVLDEQARWDLINYVRALGAGQVSPGSASGGAQYDPATQAAQQAEMLAQAVAQGVITQDEAEIFNNVHTALEQYRAAHPELAQRAASADEREAAMLTGLVEAQTITPAQAEAFRGIHDRLGASGLMP